MSRDGEPRATEKPFRQPTSPPRRKGDELAWLQTKPALSELVDQYPAEWKAIQGQLADVVARGDADEIKAHMVATTRAANVGPGGKVRSARERANAEARRQMTAHILRQAVLRSTTGVHEGRIRFGLVNGYVAQKLLFRRDLERKPVSWWQFRLVWPLLTQKRRLMPLVQPKGIWCFYSKPLLDGLVEIIGKRSCLEIAAGDGTLARFLTERGVEVTATDDHSWSGDISFPGSVRRMDARSALREYRPEVVLCSWPPPGNRFEQHVFSTDSVQTYIVITSADETSAGNWADYHRQTSFDRVLDSRLSKLVLPPEVDHAVHVFTRKSAARQP